MNEEKYTRNPVKKSPKSREKKDEGRTAEKKHGSKLKNETSANKSYREKLRYGKKDNSLTVDEAKKLHKMKKQGRRKIYKEQAVAASVRKTAIRNEDNNSGKVYVNVMAEFTKDGRLLPRSFIWKDGQIYEIQRVTDVRRAASLKAGGVGIRYTCIVNGRESHLFYEDNNMWFMEER